MRVCSLPAYERVLCYDVLSGKIVIEDAGFTIEVATDLLNYSDEPLQTTIAPGAGVHIIGYLEYGYSMADRLQVSGILDRHIRATMMWSSSLRSKQDLQEYRDCVRDMERI